jgi:peptide/nickel transport system permease protein
VKSQPNVAWPLVVLVSIYAVVLAADWIAPYDYFEQERSLPSAPPTWPHFVDTEGSFHLRPFVYRLVEDPQRLGVYEEDRSELFPIRFFVATPWSSRQFGPFEARWRLFSVDENARILLLGSDSFGRDQFSRLLYGGRLSLLTGLLAGLVAVGLGLVLGAVAGYYGGVVDAMMMRVGEVFLSLPWLYLLIGVRAFLPLEVPATQTSLLTMGLLALIGWPSPARLVRGVVLSGRRRDFVLAACGFGASDSYLLWHHVLPQARNVVVTQLTLLIPRFVLAEVTLSFLGLGVAEPVPSLGSLLATFQQYHVVVTWWWMSAPAIALIAVILSYHRLARALEERFARVVS